MTNKVPVGYHTVTPSLVVKGVVEAIELYKKAFNAKEDYRLEVPDGSGKILHACIIIGNSKIFLSDYAPEIGCSVTSVASFYLYVEDADAFFKQAKDAGLKEMFPVKAMFWGDRMGTLKDKFGVQWGVASFVKEISPEDMEDGMKEMFEEMKQNA